VPLTILEGSTFCICDDRGDIGEKTSGLFADDTRFLSLLRMTINGDRPLLLSSNKVEYFSAAFCLRNPVIDDLPQDTLYVMRERFIGEAMQDRVTIRNEGMEPVTFEVAFEFACDFADIFRVKAYDFAIRSTRRRCRRPLRAAGTRSTVSSCSRKRRTAWCRGRR
jgi:glycogen debranching enzyme